MKKFTTLKEVLGEVHKHRSFTKEGLYPHLHRLGIKPIGARQRPQLYPADTAKKILHHLGFR